MSETPTFDTVSTQKMSGQKDASLISRQMLDIKHALEDQTAIINELFATLDPVLAQDTSDTNLATLAPSEDRSSNSEHYDALVSIEAMIHGRNRRLKEIIERSEI